MLTTVPSSAVPPPAAKAVALPSSANGAAATAAVSTSSSRSSASCSSDRSTGTGATSPLAPLAPSAPPLEGGAPCSESTASSATTAASPQDGAASADAETWARLAHLDPKSLRSDPVRTMRQYALRAGQSGWFYSPECFTSTPSVKDGFLPDTERYYRQRGVHYIEAIGRDLELPTTAISTAAVYLHRFYMASSFKYHHYIECAAACLWISCKSEESPRHIPIEQFISRVAQHARKMEYKLLSPDDHEYQKWYAALVRAEEIVLRTLDFDFKVCLPYLPLALWMLLSQEVYCLGGNFLQLLGEYALSFIEEAMKTTLCVKAPAHAICAATILATLHCIPESPEQAFLLSEPWWELLCLPDDTALIEVARELCDSIRNPPVGPLLHVDQRHHQQQQRQHRHHHHHHKPHDHQQRRHAYRLPQ